jgi:hypothetical protein
MVLDHWGRGRWYGRPNALGRHARVSTRSPPTSRPTGSGGTGRRSRGVSIPEGRASDDWCAPLIPLGRIPPRTDLLDAPHDRRRTARPWNPEPYRWHVRGGYGRFVFPLRSDSSTGSAEPRRVWRRFLSAHPGERRFKACCAVGPRRPRAWRSDTSVACGAESSADPHSARWAECIVLPHAVSPG